MYVEALTTPHPEHLKPGETPQPLLSAIPVEDIRAELDSSRAGGEDAYAATVVAALPAVLEPVRRSLRYSESLGDNATTTPLDTMLANGNTHCFGYTLVTSEALSSAGIAHWIAVVGNHATTMVPLRVRGSDQLYVADGLSQEYNGDVSYALHRTSIATMRREMDDADHPRGVGMLDLRYLSERYELLRHRRPTTMTISGPDSGEKHRSLIVSTMHPAIGFRALQGTAEYQTAARYHDYQRAARALIQIPGLFYDIDARADRSDIHMVVAGLCESGDFNLAHAAIDAYCSSFGRSKDTRLTGLRADLLTVVGEWTGDSDTLARAEAAYQLAARTTKQPHYAKVIANKLAGLSRAGRLRQRLAPQATKAFAA